MLIASVEAFEQRSVEWREARIGKLTASQAKRIIGSPAVRKTLVLELAAEMLVGKAYESSGGKASRRGVELEQEALDAFAFQYGRSVEALPGLVVHPEHSRAACSPDGYLSDNAMVQIKCPMDPKNHLANAIAPDKDYIAQCQFEMWCSGREINYLCSYHPDFPPASQIIVHKIEADEEVFAKFAECVDQICSEADRYIEALS